MPPWALHEENWQMKNRLTLPGVALLQKNPGEVEMLFLLPDVPGLPVPREVLVGGSACAYSGVHPSPSAWPGLSQSMGGSWSQAADSDVL